ncbi:TetR family transcriptional regulator C-terminal domain-containing protein [Streptomyces sp. NPDC001450]
MAAALRELLLARALDEARLAECRVYVAFAARAATSPVLAAVQREALAAIHAELRQALGAVPPAPGAAARPGGRGPAAAGRHRRPCVRRGQRPGDLHPGRSGDRTGDRTEHLPGPAAARRR